jgi:hypothetical protein
LSDATPASPAPSPTPESKPAAVPQSPIAAELSVQWDKAQAKADAETPKAGTPAGIAPGQGTVTPEGPKRGEGGRFAPKDDAPKAEAKPAPEVKDAKDAKAPVDLKADPKDAKAPDAKAAPEVKAEPPKEKIAPHPRWKPEVQERFTKLADADPEMAKFVMERQKESETAFHRASQAAAKFKNLDDVLTPGREARSMQGVDDATFMRSLVAASDYLAKSPRDGIKMLAEQYGVDLAELATGGAAGAEEHPETKALRERVAQMEDFIRQENSRAVQQREQGAFQQIQSLAQAKDESGNLLYPYFADCIDDITTVVARQIESGQQPDLVAAYRKAIRLNDSVWSKLQAAESDAQRKQREEEEAQRVAEAKRAGFSVSGSGGGGDSVGGSIREELRRQFDKHYR